MTSAMDQDLYDKPDGELIHLSNWVECVRSRKRPTAPVEAGVSRRRTWATRRSMEGVTGVWPIDDLGVSDGQMGLCGRLTGFSREIRGFLTWPGSIWPSEMVPFCQSLSEIATICHAALRTYDVVLNAW